LELVFIDSGIFVDESVLCKKELGRRAAIKENDTNVVEFDETEIGSLMVSEVPIFFEKEKTMGLFSNGFEIDSGVIKIEVLDKVFVKNVCALRGSIFTALI
jgi:hypothetical protein